MSHTTVILYPTVSDLYRFRAGDLEITLDTGSVRYRVVLGPDEVVALMRLLGSILQLEGIHDRKI